MTGVRLPISSATPGTTLRMIGVDCFDGSSMLFDTPGVHLQHRLSALLLPDELKAILPLTLTLALTLTLTLTLISH